MMMNKMDKINAALGAAFVLAVMAIITDGFAKFVLLPTLLLVFAGIEIILYIEERGGKKCTKSSQ